MCTLDCSTLGKNIRVHTDSMYTINAITMNERCYMNYSAEEKALVSNIDLIELLCDLIKSVDSKFFIS